MPSHADKNKIDIWNNLALDFLLVSLMPSPGHLVTFLLRWPSETEMSRHAAFPDLLSCSQFPVRGGEVWIE